jgi:hypothetical protein
MPDVSSYSGPIAVEIDEKNSRAAGTGLPIVTVKNSAVTCGVTVEKRTIGSEVGGVLVQDRNAAKLQKKSRD